MRKRSIVQEEQQVIQDGKVQRRSSKVQVKLSSN